MKSKLSVILCLSSAYLMVTFGVSAVLMDGTNPPHAVDITGKVIPPSSATQPDKPIILAKDSVNSQGELRPEAAFDHVKHSSDTKYSVDGKSVPSCVECHHTEQPSAPKGHEYLKRFDRKEVMTAKQLETSKQEVQSCRTCHFQEGTEATGEFPPQSITYPKSMKRGSTGTLTNDVAYHTNCNTCHRSANKRSSKLKPPTGCSDCHSEK